jgi:hypothetical protein
VADGILFCGLWIFVILVVGSVIRTEILRPFLNNTEYWTSSGNFWTDWGMFYSPINNLTVIFQNFMEINKHNGEYYYNSAYAARYMREMYMFFVWGALGLAAAFGYFLTFIKKGAEKAGEVSNTWFGYRLLIPAYGYSCLLFMDAELIFTVLIFAFMIVGYALYRRGFKLKVGDVVVTACGIIPLVIGGML